ncbi:MAG: hypothetical protein K0B06_12235 [Brevefilum sp.]|nr:hypothetical protein [Brevefilum sp.]
MKKNKSLKDNIEDQVASSMDDVKSGYKDAEEKTLEAVSSAKDSVVTWVEEGVSNIKEGTHHLMDDAKETYDKTAKSIDKNVKHGLRQYNVKAQEFADKVPGVGDTVIRYPWVAITVSLLIGIALGFFLKPRRRA